MQNQSLALSQPAELVRQEQALSVQQVLGQVALIQEIMKAAMKDGEHYGRIPGCGDRPTLLKPGAEKLCLTFRMAPTYEVEERALDNGGNREYRVTCSLTSVLTGAKLGQGVGTCSSLEAKYRYRVGAAEPTDRPVPRAYWDVRGEDPVKAQELIGGKGFTVKKVDGKGWMIAKGGEKVENDNPADQWNTILKMGKKRALVDAVLTATAASDIFTQDLEDIVANMAIHGAPVVTATEIAVVTAEPKDTARVTNDTVPGWYWQAASREAGNERLSKSYDGQKVGVKRTDAGWRVVVFGEKPVNGQGEIQEAETYDADPHENDQHSGPIDFRSVRVHFGKNANLQLSELTAQQLSWYTQKWLPAKEIEGIQKSAQDEVLMDALRKCKAAIKETAES